MRVRLAAIGLHPVKSTAIRPVDAVEVGFAGLRGDREWMVVDRDREMVSARVEPRLFTVRASTRETGGTAADLLLEAPRVDPIEVRRPIDGEVDVRMFRSKELVARPAGEAADAWLREVLARDDVSLVWCHAPERRRLTRGHEGDFAAFQDGYPVTLISEESVAQVGRWVTDAARQRGEEPAAVDARRFRANLLVSGAPAPFAEDDWERVRIGDVVLRRAKLVDRCVMTTIDPDDLSRDKDPIRSLATHRRWDGSTWCAVHYIPESTGRITVGADVVPV